MRQGFCRAAELPVRDPYPYPKAVWEHIIACLLAYNQASESQAGLSRPWCSFECDWDEHLVQEGEVTASSVAART